MGAPNSEAPLDPEWRAKMELAEKLGGELSHGPRADYQFATTRLDHPWGAQDEQVRIFPPCQVKYAWNGRNPNSGEVIVFIKKGQGAIWKRKKIGSADFFPDDGFIAWDDTNNEYAWHEVGTIGVPGSVDPKPRKCVVRPDPTKTSPRARGRNKGRFMRWWTSLGNNEQDLDFLRKDRND